MTFDSYCRKFSLSKSHFFGLFICSQLIIQIFLHRNGCMNLNKLSAHKCEKCSLISTMFCCACASTGPVKTQERLPCIHTLFGLTGMQAMQLHNWSLILPNKASLFFSLKSKIHLTPEQELLYYAQNIPMDASSVSNEYTVQQPNYSWCDLPLRVTLMFHQ